MCDVTYLKIVFIFIIMSFNGQNCTMYIYQRSYIYGLMILKSTFPIDIANIILKKMLLINNYTTPYLCEKYATHTEWGDLQKGFCDGKCCWSWFHRYEYNKIFTKPAFVINEPRFGKDAPVNNF
jgi:hypothetical protein